MCIFLICWRRSSSWFCLWIRGSCMSLSTCWCQLFLCIRHPVALITCLLHGTVRKHSFGEHSLLVHYCSVSVAQTSDCQTLLKDKELTVRTFSVLRSEYEMLKARVMLWNDLPSINWKTSWNSFQSEPCVIKSLAFLLSSAIARLEETCCMGYT